MYLVTEMDPQSRDEVAVGLVLAVPPQLLIAVFVLQPILVPTFVSSILVVGVASFVIRSECLSPTVEKGKQDEYTSMKWLFLFLVNFFNNHFHTVCVKKFGLTCIAGEIFCVIIGQCGSIWLTFTSSIYNLYAGNTSFHV